MNEGETVQVTSQGSCGALVLSQSQQPKKARPECEMRKDWKDELGLEQLLTVLVLVSPRLVSCTTPQNSSLKAKF